MTLSKETLDALQVLIEKRQEAYRAYRVFESLLNADTEGVMSMCIDPDHTMLMYHNKSTCSATAALAVLKDLADDGAVNLVPTETGYNHYSFKVDRQPFMIVLDKEDSSNE